MAKKSASSDDTAKPYPEIPLVEFHKETIDEMLDHLISVEDYLTAAEEKAVKAFDGAAERGTPGDRSSIDHLADTTSALHAVKHVMTSIDVQCGMASLPGSGGQFVIDMWTLCERTGFGIETVAELYENLDDGDVPPRATDGIDLVGFVHDLIRERGQPTDAVTELQYQRHRLVNLSNGLQHQITAHGIAQQMTVAQFDKAIMELTSRKLALQASLISEADLPSPAEAAHIFAAVGAGDRSNVNERSIRAAAQRVHEGLKAGGYIKLSDEDDAILEDIARKIDEGVADADAEEDEEEILFDGSPEDRAAARFIAIDNARRPIIAIRTVGGDEVEVR